MAEISITYCVPCRYQFKAIHDADTILREFGERIQALRLIPGDHGVYDVAVNGKIIFSLDNEERFPDTLELLQKLRPLVPPAASPA